MAWVSVHEQVEGRKLRELSKSIGCSPKEALGIVVSLWLWGLNNANKYGELKGSDRKDLLEALSGGLSDGLSSDNILDCLINKEWIDLIDGIYILHDWEEWQEQWYKALDRRAYDAKRKRDERKVKSKCPQDSPQDSHEENPVQPSPSPSPIIFSSINKDNKEGQPVDNVDNSDKPSEGKRKYILVNNVLTDVTGWTREQIRQKTEDEIYKSIKDVGHLK